MIRGIRILFYFGVLSIGSSLTLTVIPTSAQTLQEELRAVLAKHPRLRAERSRAAIAGEKVRGAFSGFLPQARLSGDVGTEYVDTPIIRDPENLTRKKSTLSVTQSLFDGFRTGSKYRTAQLREAAARHRLESTRQRLIMEGIAAYYGILRQMRLVEIARRNERTIRRQLDLEDERVRRGGGIAVDQLFAKIRLQLARERTVQLSGLLADARARYEQIFGHPAVPGTMKQPDLKVAPPVTDLAGSIALAMSKNPELLAAGIDARAAARSVRTARSDYYPQLDVVGQVNWEDDVDAIRGTRQDWSVLLRMNWKLFTGLATSAAVGTALKEKATAKDVFQFRRRKVEEDIRMAWERRATAQARVELLRNAVVIAEEVFRARRSLRDAGKETAINVLDAQTELFTAQMNHIAAQFDSRIATFRLMFAMGLLTPATLGL